MEEFNSIIGHTKQKQLLANQLEKDELSHSYIFIGPDGIGKRSLAEEFARSIIKKGSLNKNRHISINHADIFRTGYDNENISINDVRRIIANTTNKPLEGIFRVFIIDHADRINPVAQNSLLKTIEEPNQGNIFILVTSNPSKLLVTIRSRCQELIFHNLNREEKQNFLKRNNIQGGMDLSLTPGEILEKAKNPEYFEELENYFNQFTSIINGDTFGLFAFAEEFAKDRKKSQAVLEYLIKRLSEFTLTDDEIDFRILRIIDILFELLEKLNYNVNLRLQWESSLIQLVTETI